MRDLIAVSTTRSPCPIRHAIKCSSVLKKGKAPDFSEARPYRRGVHPPVPSIFTLCHENRRCQRMPTATKRRRMVNAASSRVGAMRRGHCTCQFEGTTRPR
jgi:hypothetical protein